MRTYTTVQRIILLSEERARLYAQQDMDMLDAMRRRDRLRAIEDALYGLWETRRRELARSKR